MLHASRNVERRAGRRRTWPHIREYRVEDKAGVGNSGTDRWTTNTDVNPERLVIDRETDGGNSFVEEIGFPVGGV